MGNTTTYNVNSTTLKTNSVTSPTGTTTSYSYYKNASGDTQNLGPLRELKATKNQATLASVSYNYNKGVLSRINRNKMCIRDSCYSRERLRFPHGGNLTGGIAGGGAG